MTIFIYILLCLIWGSTWLGIKIGLADAPPLYLSSARFLVAILIMTPILLFKKIKLPTNPKEFIKLGTPGLFMYGGSYAMIYSAEQYISSSLTSVLFASFPFFVAMLSSFFLKSDKPNLRGWIGILIGFIGIIIISFDSFSTEGNLFFGTMLAIGGTFITASGLILHKKYFVNENIYKAITTQMLLGATPLLILAILFEDFSSITFSPVAIGSVFYLALFGTVIAFSGYYWLLQRITATLAAMIAFITPLVAIFLGVGLYGEPFSALLISSTGLVLFGVFLMVKRQTAP